MNKTKIEKKLKNKTNQELVDTIIAGKKNEKWLEVAHLISKPRRKQKKYNLDEINMLGKEGSIVVIPGKVLSIGNIDKKIKVVALSCSVVALNKMKKNKIEFSLIKEEIKKNPDAKNIQILK
ncbi:MAG TPA: 50S ribosomal protein L18e [Candidatus Paceibacterota bacterium]|nr:50S ribosomal protein L18e [Candidatus Paceibacterota bacterium]